MTTIKHEHLDARYLHTEVHPLGTEVDGQPIQGEIGLTLEVGGDVIVISGSRLDVELALHDMIAQVICSAANRSPIDVRGHRLVPYDGGWVRCEVCTMKYATADVADKYYIAHASLNCPGKATFDPVDRAHVWDFATPNGGAKFVCVRCGRSAVTLSTECI